MTRGQRALHRGLWLMLAPLLVLGLAVGGVVAMSQTFVTVQWNRRKYVYDALVVGGIAVYSGCSDG